MSAELRVWKERLAESDTCPWPGPRPLGVDDSALLVGRVPVRREFRRLIQQHRLILLHGPSGVGKSSVLRAGLIGDLEAEGSRVFHNDQWGGLPHDDVRSYLVRKLGLPGQDADAPFDELAQRHGDKAVLVLDQFEELVRYSPRAARRVFDLIVDLNQRYKTKIVISFRSEYLHEFAELEQRAVGFSFAQFPLREIPDDAAERVILAGNKGRSEQAITPDAAERLATMWQRAREHSDTTAMLDDPFNRIGLLHLQAMLYSLYFSLHAVPITSEDVDAVITEWADQRATPGTKFQAALRRAVDFKLEHCETATRETMEAHIDESFVAGARWMLERTVPHLSSGGYKLIRGAEELSRLAIGVDYQALREGLATPDPLAAGQLRRIFEVVLDAAELGDDAAAFDDGEGGDETLELLGANRAAFAAAADLGVRYTGGTRSWCDRLATLDSSQFDHDKLQVSCGPLLGMAPADVFIEELRRFAFALVWLENSSLIRVTTPAGSGTMVSLVHDGFGSALTEWAERRSGDPEGPLSAITAPRGASYAWSAGPSAGIDSQATVSGPSDGHRLLINLRVRGGWIQADLRRVAFVNCDLRGTIFDGCYLEGVVFVNCLLDGTIFSDCTVAGPLAQGDPAGGWSEDEPEFVLVAPSPMVAAHAALRGRSFDALSPRFRSDVAGNPAVPFNGEPARTVVRYGDSATTPEVRRLDATLGDGGLTVYGGRVSSLLIRGCTIQEGSAVAIRHSTGSGLDMVEVVDSPGRLDIFGSAIRHMTVSATPGGTVEPRIAVTVANSTMTQLYVGSGLTGSFHVTSSALLHAWNGSPYTDSAELDGPVGVRFTADDCTVHGTLDIEATNSATAGVGPQIESATTLGIDGLVGRMARMDYRRNPARQRERQRSDQVGS